MNRWLMASMLAGSLSSAPGAWSASSDTPGSYDPRQAFAPLALPQPVNAFRSADGTPGPQYWQNRADYTIHASIDTSTHALSASEVIAYTNNSPSALDCLWIQLDQNIYRNDSRSRYASGRASKGFTEGFILESVEIERQGHIARATTVISDTRLQVRLDGALAAHGGKLNIHIRYHYQIPGEFGGRTAHASSRNGEIYDLAQWYPRMAVFDDLRGWDTLPYIGSEFYLEYGDFDYYVTVPWDMLVAGSGELANPQEVLTATQQARLARARNSEQTVLIRSAEEVSDPKSRPVSQGSLTWHYRMRNTRDVAFSASRAFIWDAARITLPGNAQSLAMSFYPIESAGPDGWVRDTQYLRDAVQNFSRRWGSYPWPAAVAVAGPVSGMEYPAMVFDGIEDNGKFLFWITAHEIGHSWFPMMVGFNERRDQWMDEGFNTFIDVYESDDFDHGVYGPKRDSEYAAGGGNPVDEILPVLADPAAPVMLTRAEQVTETYRHSVTYFKSALGLTLLREQILGPERFDWAFRKFIRDWTYRHPSPSDFFRAMESAGGEDLSWFWRGWYFNNWTLDLATTGAVAAEGGWQNGALISVVNRDPLVMPAVIEVGFQDGSSSRIALPAETWIKTGSANIKLDSTQPVTSVTVDPDHRLPDRDRSNNVWKAPAPP
jgi:Peptidase family M1 domain